MDESTTSRRPSWGRIMWCLFFGSGMIGTLLIYGLLQERIMSIPYGETQELFIDSIFLVLCNRLVAVVFALVMIAVRRESFINKAPLWKYVILSISHTTATSCQYEALRYVTFPVQMLGKSFKMMPVMLFGMAVSGKSYNVVDWLLGGAVTCGIVEFLMTGPIASVHTFSAGCTHGLVLLVAFLFLDGFASTFQEKLFKDPASSKYNEMLYINLCSSGICLATLLLSGRLGPVTAFAQANPEFAVDAMALSAAAVGGQWFIYSQVKEFGALVLVATMNVRQMISIVISYFVYRHPITMLQVYSLTLVFSALFYKSFRALSQTPDTESEKMNLMRGNSAAFEGRAPVRRSSRTSSQIV
mmetsp:Transcript_73241/g.158897  ORF Transcript_73241/g.158897 Transcript_73241/m.158897 type:complete len:357 (+) Transcript_73241:90-1160(+)|eukprot:CAMPEP_0170603418 /NCGR_PEP_ID=MMETSP0224-20130122/18902_1 /TAXON_ID=285029 /ORGANISM="Togula jolla, Strain CCCM 725" /LENGTH=356 /DNA_ID=CAMNT_0010928299 /DNA_START=84 /DNA_END=1154 /DNA_ORIENTATION=+